MRSTLIAALLCAVVAAATPTLLIAAELPRTSESHLAGMAFDDKPLTLPIAHNFQVALTTVGKELGRSCGPMESFGWRMSTLEQQRVNRIFGSTIDRLRALGYTVTAQKPKSVARDITVFTAKRPDRDLMFMWSAGELGLVLLICDTQEPGQTMTAKTKDAKAQKKPKTAMSAATVPLPEAGGMLAQEAEKEVMVDAYPKFSPTGRWIGSYTCAQGLTGGTLSISELKGESFKGIFRFYPTPENPGAAAGSYRISGQYDRETKRILVQPGAWLERPKDYYNAIIVGKFNPARKKFSGVFQGVSGCTSFEAKYADGNTKSEELKAKPAKKKTAKKKPVKKVSAAKKEAVPEVKSEMGATVPGTDKPINDAIRLDDKPELKQETPMDAKGDAMQPLPTPPAEMAPPPAMPGVTDKQAEKPAEPAVDKPAETAKPAEKPPEAPAQPVADDKADGKGVPSPSSTSQPDNGAMMMLMPVEPAKKDTPKAEEKVIEPELPATLPGAEPAPAVQ